MALIHVARAIFELGDEEITVMAEEFADCAGLENFVLLGTNDTVQLEEVSGALRLWADHVIREQEA
ncbi:hypothetical protein MACH17_25620 [Phaeobacter inhibens]|nr:hypothetical protein MACH17_25620 [Phaeobacter inhibens]